MADNMSTHESFDAPGTAVSNDAAYQYLEVGYTKEDAAILRELAREYMACATLPVQQKTIRLWQDVNDLRPARPVLMHSEIPWHEMNVDDELTLVTSTPFAQRIEQDFRRRLYMWRHMPGDMVLEPVCYAPMIITNSGVGLTIDETTSATDAQNNIVGHAFTPTITCEEDLEQLVLPVVDVDREKTQRTLDAYHDILDGVIPVELRGCPGFWFAPMDDIVQYMGVEDLLVNLACEPELVHATMRRVMDCYLAGLDQYEKLGALATNNTNYRIGSGAYGYTRELPAGTPNGMQCAGMWGAAASQIFTSVSPAMHDEFSIQYEKEWLDRFPLSYYGCCERLDTKIDILSQIKSLRKISISPWSDAAHAAEVIGRKYVISLKPSPACLAFDTFDEELVRREVGARLEAIRGCNAEVVIKDISTVRYQPERLWKWVEIVHELCRSYE
ncbi:MAG: hypothetical protein ACI4PD_05575 [Butyricicoccus sp.]